MNLIPELLSGGHVQAEVNGCLGLITLNRPEAMNALTLPMIRDPPSEIAMMVKLRLPEPRVLIFFTSESIEYGISGIKITSAPPAMPDRG